MMTLPIGWVPNLIADVVILASILGEEVGCQ